MYLLFQTVCHMVLMLPKLFFFGRFSRPTILALLLPKSCALHAGRKVETRI